MKTVRIFFDRIRDRIRLEMFRSVCIRVRIFYIRYRIRIRIIKSYIYDVDIQSYLIRHGWHYSYSNPNPTKNMKTNVISAVSVRIRSVFIPAREWLRHPNSCLLFRHYAEHLVGGWWIQDAYARLVNMRMWINISQDLLQVGETNNSTGRATMLVSVLLGTHHMHHRLASEPG
jgi:hypothetical protein